jgi:hypothetical protein
MHQQSSQQAPSPIDSQLLGVRDGTRTDHLGSAGSFTIRFYVSLFKHHMLSPYPFSMPLPIHQQVNSIWAGGGQWKEPHSDSKTGLRSNMLS